MTINKRDFNASAPTWDEQPRRIQLASDIAAAVLREVPVDLGMNAMDFGCGTGLITLALRPYVRSITGVDSSQGMLDVLNQKIASLRLDSVRTQLVDPTDGDALTGPFDLIVSGMTLHHIQHTSELLDGFYKILNPGGYLCIADLDPEDGLFHDDHTGVFHDGFDRDLLRSAFETAGFTDVHVTTASTTRKTNRIGVDQDFTVFLMSGRK